MPVRLVAHNEDKIRYFEEVQDEVFRPGDLNSTLAAFDADGTMFPDDLGVLFFIEKLLDPHYWRDYDEQTFAELLLPEKYLLIFRKGAAGTDHELSKELCKFILDLSTDIIALYRVIRESASSGFFPAEAKDVSEIHTHPLVNEFARKMIALDKVIMSIDTLLSQRLDNDLLLRTRFLQDRFTDDIRRITAKVWTNAREHIVLEVDDSREINQQKKLVRPDHPMLKGSRLQIRIHPNAGRRSLEIAHRLLVPGDTARIRVVTTNHPIIIDESVRQSPWNEILHSEGQRILPEDPLVIGTRLQRNRDTQKLMAEPKAKPLIGARKKEIVMQLEKSHGRRCRVALGDTPGDLQMGIRAAAENNGIFCVVTHENGMPAEEAVNRTKERFHEALARTGVGTEDIHEITQRFYYLMPSETQQAAGAVRVA